MRHFSNTLIWSTALVLVLCNAAHAGSSYNDKGWIEMQAWNLLYPLGNPQGCSGGGLENMLSAEASSGWTAPVDFRLEDPAAGDEWPIDFRAARSSAWHNPLFREPTWTSTAHLNGRFPNQGPFPEGDTVNFQLLADHIVEEFGAGVTVTNDNVLGIATTYVRNLTGERLDLGLCVSSDDSIAVYLNNKLVHANSVCRADSGDCQDTTEVVLPAGISRLTVLVWEGGGGHSFRLGLFAGAEQLLSGNNFVEFLGPGDGRFRGQVQYCLDRSIDDARDDCARVECDDATSVLLEGFEPRGFPGSSGDPIRIIEEIRPTSGLARDLQIPDDGGAEIQSIIERARANTNYIFALPLQTVVGSDAGRASKTSIDDRRTPNDLCDDIYTSLSTTDGEIGAGEDAFEYSFTSSVTGDFDVAVEILGAAHETGVASLAQFGLMARTSTAVCSRFSMIQNRGVNGAAASFLRRPSGQSCAVQTFAGPGGGLAQPRFMRLTRRGTVVTGWLSNHPGLGTGELQSCIDSHWTKVYEDDWFSAPRVFVGFANSESSEGGADDQTVDFRVLCSCNGNSELVGLRLIWDVDRRAANDGLKYAVCANSAGGFQIEGSFEDEAGSSTTVGPSAIKVAQSPVGIWDGCEDIGPVQAAGSTTFSRGVYTQTGQGKDIWTAGDELHFAYSRVSGDFALTARISDRTQPTHGSRWGKHGLMARYSCDPASAFHFQHSNLASPWGPNPNDSTRIIRRTPHLSTASIKGVHFLSPELLADEGQEPTWMRMIRRGNAIYQYVAEDSNGRPRRWYLLGSSADPEMPSQLLVGMAITSHSGVPATIRYDNVELESLDEFDDSRVCVARDTVYSQSYERAGDAEGLFLVEGFDGSIPGIEGGRLRMIRDGVFSDKNAAWVALSNESLGSGAFEATTNVSFSPDGVNKADGMTITLIQVGRPSDLDNLDPISAIGNSGGALGYEGGRMALLPQLGYPSISVELDNWRNGFSADLDPNGSNCVGCEGVYHVGVNLNGDITSVQTNVDFDIGTLPNIYDPKGIRVSVLYDYYDDNPHGQARLEVFLESDTYPRTKVLSTPVIPLIDDVLIGFTAGTGGATVTADVAGLSVTRQCCEAPDSLTILGDDTIELDVVGKEGVNTIASLQAVGQGIDAGGVPSYGWEFISGPGFLNFVDGDQAAVEATGPGVIAIEVSFSDGLCDNVTRRRYEITVTGTLCPEEGDTHCRGLDFVRIGQKGDRQLYRFTADAFDDNEGPIFYAFSAVRDDGTRLVSGIQDFHSHDFDLLPGRWTVSVAVDDDLTCADRAADSICEVIVDVEEGPCSIQTAFGNEVNVTIDRNEPTCICVQAPPPRNAGRPVVIEAQGSHRDDRIAIYARWNSPASPVSYDYFVLPDSSTARLVIPSARIEDLYILVQSVERGDGATDVLVTPRLQNIAVGSMVPDCHANVGTVRAAVHGGGLRSDSGFALIHAITGNRIAGRLIRFLNAGTAEVDFDVDSERLGAYHLAVDDDQLDTAFKLSSGDRGVEIGAQIRSNGVYRLRRPRALRIAIQNSGDESTATPRLELRGPPEASLAFSLVPDGPMSDDRIVFEAQNPLAAAGILPPGEPFLIPIFFEGDGDVVAGQWELRNADTNALLATRLVQFVDSRDPNTKEGPVGTGDGGDLIPPDESIAYTVHFENEPGPRPELAAPVQQVRIVDVIESDLDISTLEIGLIHIGSNTPIQLDPLTPCLGSSECLESEDDVFISNALGDFTVRISARVDEFERSITWEFDTLGLGPDDDLLGFLLVSDRKDLLGQSEGSVSFTIDPNEPKADETDITNQATITFDENVAESLDTNETHHRIVLPPFPPVNPTPASALNPLVSLLTPVALSWEDGGRTDSFRVMIAPEGDPLSSVGTTAGTTMSVSGLAPDTVYTWQVIAINEAAETPSEIWTFQTAPGGRFVRGDVDDSGAINITDAIVLLDFLFLGGRSPTCMDAADIDDNGGNAPDITDGIYILLWLFQGGAPPPSPSPSVTGWLVSSPGDCGFDTTDGPPRRPDTMGCNSFRSCQ